MPYKNVETQKDFQHKWYLSNKDKNVGKYVESNRKVRAEYRKWYLEIKSRHKCIKCGEPHPACLDFHHRDGTSKNDVVSSMVGNKRPKKVILEEIEKCDVLCSNCHRKLHHYLDYK